MTNLSQKELQELSKKLKSEGVTQKEIAKEAGYTERYVQMVLAGDRDNAKIVTTAKQLLADKSISNFSEALKKHSSILQVL